MFGREVTSVHYFSDFKTSNIVSKLHFPSQEYMKMRLSACEHTVSETEIVAITIIIALTATAQFQTPQENEPGALDEQEIGLQTVTF
jgi:hypothetical protein